MLDGRTVDNKKRRDTEGNGKGPKPEQQFVCRHVPVKKVVFYVSAVVDALARPIAWASDEKRVK